MNYIDLGLSVKWADCNVGANSPEEFGSYFNRDESKKIKDIIIPTLDQWQELQSNCTCKLDKNKKGWTITGKNGNKIYLPIAGEGKNNPNVKVMGAFFWSSDDTEVNGLPFTWFAAFDVKSRKDTHLLDPEYWISVRGVQ